MQELISIVMPAFNAERTISRSIESIINQTYQHWELIICDDGSSDKTLDIIQKVNDPRIVTTKNIYGKGAASARNSCISLAKGRYIAFLDSDDLWKEDKLEIQLNYMISNELDFTYGSYYIFSNEQEHIMGVFEPAKRITIDKLLKSCDIGCLTVMIKRSSMPYFRFPSSAKEDYAAWIICLQHKVRIAKYPGVLAYYRISKNSLSSNKLKEIKRQFSVVREYGRASFFKATYYVFCYILNGTIKHFFKYRSL
ncbi:glycosyltransferase family 2 protein [Vibrio alginolyticus]